MIALINWIDSKLDITTAFSLLVQCKKFGIKGIFESTNPETRTRIANARRIRIMVVSGNALIKSIKENLIQALREKKALIQIIVGSKDSEYVKDVEEMESESRTNQISGEIETTEGFLKEYLKEAKKSNSPDLIGKIKIGYSSTQLRSSIIIVDDEWGWLTLYLPPKRALQSVSFLLKSTEQGILKDCITHFDRTWEILEKKHTVFDIPKK